MLRYYGLAERFPFLTTVGEILYYSTIIGTILLFSVLAARKLVTLGYSNKRAVTFSILVAVLSFPLGYYGSRAAGMFYQPIGDWSFQLLADNILHGHIHTFHASIILPLFAILVYCRILKFKISEVVDTVFLYVPLAHAMGRVSCLFIGCCWGKYVPLTLWGVNLSFYNPVPLYAIIINTGIFLVLRRVHGHIYRNARTREIYRGAVFASYFVLYGACRTVLEVFRIERKVFFGLTNAQIVMILFVLVGTIVFFFIYRRVVNEEHSPGCCYGKEDHDATELIRIFTFAGLLVVLLLFTVAAFHLTRVMFVWQWPFQPVKDLAEAYQRIWYYAPIMMLPVVALYWLKIFNVPFMKYFKRGRFSWSIVIVFLVSAFYTFELLFIRGLELRGIAFWPPVLILSAMNAFSEEITYRLSLYEVLQRAGFSETVSNIIQSLVYSLIHFMIAGALLGMYSFVYGFLLGVVRRRTGSIMPGVLCHFIIDLGAIGMPLLRY
ncbi:MAG: hypothetical protein AVO39_11330 [delta proteobacterium MLS_D]|jgi:phosphatidylglycerol---prolipoprotein diacylglyceryl transferase|nr:MAG: hypothetical protein AVO39_11330 [delta proteobacterium MLS_D]